jgi:hypothetical protein
MKFTKESEFQKYICKMLDDHIKAGAISYYFSVPNGSYFSGGYGYINMMKSTGLKSGVADLVVILTDSILFLELKLDKGVVSDSQKQFKQIIEATNHHYLLLKPSNLQDLQTIITKLQ